MHWDLLFKKSFTYSLLTTTCIFPSTPILSSHYLQKDRKGSEVQWLRTWILAPHYLLWNISFNVSETMGRLFHVSLPEFPHRQIITLTLVLSTVRLAVITFIFISLLSLTSQPILTPSLHVFTKNTSDLYVAKSNNYFSVIILLEVQAAADNVNTFFLEHPLH